MRDVVSPERREFLMARLRAALHGGAKGLAAFDAAYPDEAVWRFETWKQQAPDDFSLSELVTPKAMEDRRLPTGDRE